MAAGAPTGPPRWWGPPPASQPPAASADVMNQLCRVCGEPAAGFHFGAFTCEGCKSFFGRTYNNLSSISECKNNGECVINKKNRTSCKACRLRKCLLVGMSKSGSRYGRRSNWFKIHCLLQEQQQGQHPSGGKPAKVWDAAAFQAKHILDMDNNNTPVAKEGKEQRAVSPLMLSHGFSSAGEAAAALWAARSSLLPVHPHHPGLPFYAPPFLHGARFHQPPPSPNFLIPFMTPRHTLPEQPAISPSSSSSSSSPASPTAFQTTSDKSTTTDLFNYDKSLSVLRSLGPVQDSPMDLSFNSRDRSGGSELDDLSDDDDEGIEPHPDDSKDSVKEIKLENETEKRTITTPLDLTCAAKS